MFEGDRGRRRAVALALIVALAFFFFVLQMVVEAQAFDSPVLPPVEDPEPAPAGTELVDVLLWMAFSGGSGVIAYWFIDRFRRDEWSAEFTRYVAFGVTALLAAVGFGLLVIMGYEPAPTDARAWVERLFSTCFVAVLMAQVIHARRDLAKREAA